MSKNRRPMDCPITRFLEPYEGKWVVVSNKEVVASGETLREALDKKPAEVSLEDSFVFKVPHPGSYIYAAIA